MLAWISKPIDWLTIQLARRVGWRLGGHCCIADRGLPQNLDVISEPVVPTVPELSLITPKSFRFRSAVTTRWPENNIVHGCLDRCGPDWQDKPAVILLHGWNGERGYRCQFPYLAWRLCRAGNN